MPPYVGPMLAWRCSSCGGVTHLRPSTVPPSTICMMMGCGGRVRRAPEADWAELDGMGHEIGGEG